MLNGFMKVVEKEILNAFIFNSIAQVKTLTEHGGFILSL